MVDEAEETEYASGTEYYEAEVLPAIEQMIFSEAVSMYKVNQQVSGWIKQMEDEEAKN